MGNFGAPWKPAESKTIKDPEHWQVAGVLLLIVMFIVFWGVQPS